MSKQAIEYFELINPCYIKWDFYKKYIDIEPPFSQVGLITYLRTYSRYVEELGRREYWRETCLRVVEYSLSLDNVSGYENKRKEAEELFDTMFNLRGFSSGRSLWTAGTKQTEVDSSSGWNCCYKSINTISSFSEIFYWLMIGAGTGFSVQKKYIKYLPKFKHIYTNHKEYEPVAPEKRLIYTSITYTKNNNVIRLIFTDGDLKLNDKKYKSKLKNIKSNTVHITIGDSKEGWCNALRIFLHLCSSNTNIENVIFNYNNIRPVGERIKTFGGRSSGYLPMKELFINIENIIKERIDLIPNYKKKLFKKLNINLRTKLTSVDILDIVNSIGLGVVSGGVRRTAQISLGDEWDTEFKEAKNNLWVDESKVKKRKYRVMSNNSILVNKEPKLETLKHMFEVLKTQGDPGIWNIGNANKLAESKISGTNPCAEAGLDDSQTCNLTTTNVLAHTYYDINTNTYKLNLDSLTKTIKLITRIGVRQTLADQWHPVWDKMQKRDRLLGVSLTGVQDCFDLLSYSNSEKEIFYQTAKKIAIEEANKYCELLGINKSTRVTLIKPEGTISLLPGVSSGIHKNYSPYFIRRIRFSKNDPLVQTLYYLGYIPTPENDQGDSIDDPKCNTVVFTFPVKSNATKRAIDYTAEEQLEEYLLAQRNYCDRGHNASFTCTLRPNEYETIVNKVYSNWKDIIGVSFLPTFDPELDKEACYPQLPLESCSEEIFHNMNINMEFLSEEELINLLSTIEKEYDENLLDSDCTGKGFCPVR